MESIRNSRNVRSAVEILDILNLARSHRWSFSYLVCSERRQTSHTTEIVSIDSQAGIIVVGSEVKYSGLTANVPVIFRAQSGGISLQFETQLIGIEGNALASRLFIECRLRYPKEIRFAQMRKAIRISCRDLDDIQVTLFADGTTLNGEIADISETGAKIRFEGNLSYQFQESRMVTDCHMRLPDGAFLNLRVKILGFIYDKQTDVSYLRCYFLEIKEDRHIKLREFISRAQIGLLPAAIAR